MREQCLALAPVLRIAALRIAALRKIRRRRSSRGEWVKRLTSVVLIVRLLSASTNASEKTDNHREEEKTSETQEHPQNRSVAVGNSPGFTRGVLNIGVGVRIVINAWERSRFVDD